LPGNKLKENILREGGSTLGWLVRGGEAKEREREREREIKKEEARKRER